VPDVAAALRRVEQFGYEIIKPLGEAEERTMGVNEEIVDGKEGDVVEGYKHVFRQLAFVRDPDVSDFFFEGLLMVIHRNRIVKVKLTCCRAIGSSWYLRLSNPLNRVKSIHRTTQLPEVFRALIPCTSLSVLRRYKF
jgi:hypothetical protein